jgi:hypothetical protein
MHSFSPFREYRTIGTRLVVSRLPERGESVSSVHHLSVVLDAVLDGCSITLQLGQTLWD